MTERDQTASGQPIRLDAYQPVPAARPLSDFHVEQVGDDLVILDGETMQYHTLNSVATTIWRACDGAVTLEYIAVSTGLPVEVVETTVAELGEASLLQTSASAWTVPMNRRRAAKLIAAGAVGAVGVPVVLSITAPSNQAAASWTTCGLGASCDSGDTCTAAFGPLECDFVCQQGFTGRWRFVPVNCVFGADGQFLGASDGVEEVIDDTSEFRVTSSNNDPYLGDEDGNVDVNSIQADSVEEAVATDEVPAADVPVEDTSAADASADSNSGDSEPVETSSDSEEAPTEEANG